VSCCFVAYLRSCWILSTGFSISKITGSLCFATLLTNLGDLGGNRGFRVQLKLQGPVLGFSFPFCRLWGEIQAAPQQHPAGSGLQSLCRLPSAHLQQPGCSFRNDRNPAKLPVSRSKHVGADAVVALFLSLAARCQWKPHKRAPSLTDSCILVVCVSSPLPADLCHHFSRMSRLQCYSYERWAGGFAAWPCCPGRTANRPRCPEPASVGRKLQLRRSLGSCGQQ
jgi:hypothetical protein